jgi:hypothetical protein
MRKKRLLIPLLLSLCVIFSMGSLSAMAETYTDASTGNSIDYTYDGTTLSVEENLDGDLLVKTGESDYDSENSSVIEVAPGATVDLKATLDASAIDSQLKTLQSLLTSKINEEYADIIRANPVIATFLQTDALAKFMALSDTESTFDAVFEIPDGLTAPGDLKDSAKLDSGSDGLYVIKDVKAEGSSVTVSMGLKDGFQADTLDELKTDVGTLPAELTLEMPGFTVDESVAEDTKLVVKGELTGNLSSNVSGTDDAVKTLGNFGIQIPEKKIALSWKAVQSKDGADADNKTGEDITLTLKTYKALAKDFTVDGDLLVKTGDAEFNTEHEAVYTVAPGSVVDLEAMLAFSDVKDQLKALQDEILAKVPEGEALLDGVKLDGTESTFEAVFTIPEGLTLPSEPKAELKDCDLYEVKDTAAEGNTLTVTMALKGEYPTFGDLRKAVEGAKDEMLLDINGFETEDAPDKTYTVTGTLTGSLNTQASVESVVRNIELSWEAVQKADGTDAVAGADSETIQLTIATFGSLEKSYEVGGDLLVSKSGDPAFDTEHEKVFETTPDSVVDLEAMLAFSDVKDQLKALQDEILGKVPQGEALLDEVKLDGTESTFEAVFEIPEGLTLPSEPKAELKDCDLYEVKDTVASEDGKTLTVTMALKGEYSTFGDLRKAVEGAKDEMLLDIKGVTVGDADDQTYTVKGTLEGSLNTTASLVSSQLAVGKIITINWEAVQTEDGTDFLLGSSGIQLSIHAAQPQLNKEDHFAYVIGYPDGTVKPEVNITRAEVATIFFRLLTDQSRAQNWSKTNNFTDVKSTDWFNNAVSTMSKAGIINGYPDKTFLPQNEITRAEFATIAARFDSSEPDTSGSKLTDIAGHWAEKYIKKAEALGYVTGYEDGSFKPDQPITRAEAMTLINRVLERMDNNIGVDGLLPEAEMNTWTDNMNKSAWYYTAVQEATNSHTYDNKQIVPDDKINHYTETWVEKIADPDWAALEKEWSKANDE